MPSVDPAEFLQGGLLEAGTWGPCCRPGDPHVGVKANRPNAFQTQGGWSIALCLMFSSCSFDLAKCVLCRGFRGLC